MPGPAPGFAPLRTPVASPTLARAGGTYAPTASTPPWNPHLRHLPARDEAIAIAALCQALFLWHWKLRQRNATFRVFVNGLINENKWRAARYGLDSKMIDFGKQAELPARSLMRELVKLVGEEIAELGGEKRDRPNRTDPRQRHQRRPPAARLRRNRRRRQSCRRPPRRRDNRGAVEQRNCPAERGMARWA